MTGIPFKHAVKCLPYMIADLEELVHECHTIKRYKETYDRTMCSVRDTCFWPPLENIPLLPHPLLIGKEAPLKRGEKGIMIRAQRR